MSKTEYNHAHYIANQKMLRKSHKKYWQENATAINFNRRERYQTDREFREETNSANATRYARDRQNGIETRRDYRRRQGQHLTARRRQIRACRNALERLPLELQVSEVYRTGGRGDDAGVLVACPYELGLLERGIKNHLSAALESVGLSRLYGSSQSVVVGGTNFHMNLLRLEGSEFQRSCFLSAYYWYMRIKSKKPS